MAKSNFDSLFKRIFGKKSPHAPIIHEVLQRSERYRQEYEAWQRSLARRQLMDRLRKAYELELQGLDHDEQVYILRSPYANGIALQYDTYIGKDNFSFLFDFFRDRVKEMGYRLATSDRRIMDRETHAEVIEKHYLKPPPSLEVGQPLDQLFGNVQIEMRAKDEKPELLKVTVSIYSDRQYQEARSFEEFARQLLQV